MTAWRIIYSAAAALLFLVPAARAQEAPTIRIATCNLGKVLEAMDERPPAEAKMVEEQKKVTAEGQKRQAGIADLENDLKNLKPGGTLAVQKSRDAVKAKIDAQVWFEMAKLDLARMEKEHLKQLYDHIREACKEVADARKIDIVLTERSADIPDDPRLTVDNVKARISQGDVLYSNGKADITQEVIAAVNRKYLQSKAPAEAPK